jgi:alpha-galactosidase
MKKGQVQNLPLILLSREVIEMAQHSIKRHLVIWLMAIMVTIPGIINVAALNNGLALTPPMGWNSWNVFQANIDENKIKGIADAMVSSGMKNVGYQYVVIDDSWMASARDGSGNLVANSTKFPSGIKALADYVHSKGLKFGIYESPDSTTCQNLPGSYGHEQQDANLFASWGVDYLKYDSCGTTGQAAFQTMRDCLKNTGRDIVYSTNPSFYTDSNVKNWIVDTANLWRTTQDIKDYWGPGNPPAQTWARSVMQIIDENEVNANLAGPGHWNDCDMLEVGNYGLDGNPGMNDTEYKSHFSLWCIMASPLIAGNDLRSMNQASKDILTASEVIAVNQDSLGKQGRRVKDLGELEVWSKTLNGSGVRAVLLLNRSTAAANITVNWSDIGLANGNAVVRDLWAKLDLGTYVSSYTASNIPAHGVVVVKITGTEPTPTPTPTPGSGTLLSLNKTATASSFQTGNEVAKGNDGDLATRWAAGSATFPQWWKVDLGAGYSLSRMDINWYSSANRAYKYKIEVSGDDSTYTMVIDKTGNTAFGDTSDTFSATGKRYVRVTVTGCSASGGYASAYEFKVYGSSGSTSTPASTPTSTPTPTPTSASTSTPTPTPGSWTGIDIGAVGAAGSFSSSSGTYTVYGSGVDVYNTSDECYLVYKQLTGDFTITTRVVSASYADIHSQFGLMARNTTSADSQMITVFWCQNDGTNHVKSLARTTVGGSTGTSVAVTAPVPPVYLKLTRAGSTFTTYWSSNGTTYTQVKQISITMNSAICVGMYVCSHVDGTLANASFDTVSVN